MHEESNKGERLLGLSDAVFGIAITFLAVDFVVPISVDNDGQLANYLRTRLSNYIVYFVSFVVIGFMWWEHHRTHQFAPFGEERQRALGVHALMFVAATPFASSLVGHNPTLPLALFLFFAILALMSAANLKSWQLGAATDRNVSALSVDDITYLHRQLTLTTAAFGLCAVLAVVAHLSSLPHWTTYFGLLLLAGRVVHHRRTTTGIQDSQASYEVENEVSSVATNSTSTTSKKTSRVHLAHRLKQGSDTERLIVFTDGVYAISMTLVAMRLTVPDTPFPSDHALLSKYLHNGQWRPFMAYIVTFIILAGFWRVHCVIYDRVRKTDTTLLWLNLAHLLGIGLLPFAEEMLMMDAVGPVSCGVYVGMLLLSTASLASILLVASHRGPAFWQGTSDSQTQHLRLAAWGYVLCLIPTLVLVIFPIGQGSEVWLSTLCSLMLVKPAAAIWSGRAPMTRKAIALAAAAPCLVTIVIFFDSLPSAVAWLSIAGCLLCIGRVNHVVQSSRTKDPALHSVQ